jgi:hypothetical protein
MEKALRRLDHILSVQNIMTPAQVLERADSIEDATQLFNEYDVVPYPKTGRIEGFFKRNSNELIKLQTDHLISNATSLLDMPKLLYQASFYFVISAHTIAGYVHYSDLNKPTMKIPLFLLFHAMENSVWARIKDQITEDIVRKVFQGSAQDYIKKRDRAKKSNVDIGWMGIFTLPSILRLAKYFQTLDLSDDQIKLLGNNRNNVAHADKNLVNSHADTAQLVKAVKLCQSILKSK